MATFIALLRGINVGGRKIVPMADLRALLAGLGLGEPRSLLQSGNLVFTSARRGGSGLENRLETEARKRLGLEADFMVRTAEEWKGIVAHNPFPEAARRDPGRLLVLFLKAAPGAAAAGALRAAITGRETFEIRGREAYVVYPDGVGRSRLTGALIERHLGTRATGRNWNTVLRLAAMAGV